MPRVFGVPRLPPQVEHDELDELPPIDGDADDEETPSAEGEPVQGGESAGDPLDDSTGEQDPVEPEDMDVDPQDVGWLDEPADNPDLDVGEEIAVGVSAADDVSSEESDGPGGGEEEIDPVEGADTKDLDAGEEGPVDEDEELRDEDLPRLDADDERELEGEALLDEQFSGDEPLGVPWAAEPWSRVGAPVVVSGALAIACAGRGAIVAVRRETGGTELQHVDLEGTRSTIPALGMDDADVRVVSVSAGRVAVVSSDGRVHSSSDEGGHFAPAAKDIGAADVVLSAETLWVLARVGSVWAFPTTAGAVGVCSARACVAAIAADQAGGVTALLVDPARRPAAVLVAQPGASLSHQPVAAGLEPIAAGRLAVRSNRIAYPWRRGVVVRDASGAWRCHRWEGRVTALAFVDDVGTLLVATYSDADDTTALVRLDASGHASVVARLGAVQEHPDSDGRAVAVVSDDPRGVVWVAGGFGVAAFAVR